MIRKVEQSKTWGYDTFRILLLNTGFSITRCGTDPVAVDPPSWPNKAPKIETQLEDSFPENQRLVDLEYLPPKGKGETWTHTQDPPIFWVPAVIVFRGCRGRLLKEPQRFHRPRTKPFHPPFLRSWNQVSQSVPASSVALKCKGVSLFATQRKNEQQHTSW